MAFFLHIPRGFRSTTVPSDEANGIGTNQGYEYRKAKAEGPETTSPWLRNEPPQQLTSGLRRIHHTAASLSPQSSWASSAPSRLDPIDLDSLVPLAQGACMKRASPDFPDFETSSPQVMTDTDAQEQEVALRVKWGGSIYAVELSTQSTVLDLKKRLYELTEVLPKRQKVLGLPFVSGRPPADGLVLSELSLKPDQRLMLVGSREEDISAVNAVYEAADNVINDLDVDYDGDDNRERLRNMYRKRLERRIETTEFRIINQPRPGKKLLVLDLDYTLFDCRGHAETIAGLGRPGLHRFLASVYHWYDIVIWSQTSWRWLEAKLTGLSMLFSSEYKLSFVLDRTSMFSITTRKGRQERTHEVKALEIIWRKFPSWDSTNTIHVDDLSKNFALNPQSGLKISPYKNAHVAHQFDRELYMLDRYLVLIAEREPDFTKLKHKHWKRYCSAHAGEGAAEETEETEEPEQAENTDEAGGEQSSQR